MAEPCGPRMNGDLLGGMDWERHARGRGFDDQPIMVIPQLLGDNRGISHRYQAIKKLQESYVPPDG